MTTLEPETDFHAFKPASPFPEPSPQPPLRTCNGLLEAARRAGNAIAGEGFPCRMSDGGSGLEPATLLALVSYGYASEVFASGDVERLIALQPELNELCRGNIPDAQCIRRFRRENRDAIEKAVAAALQHMVEEKVREGSVARCHSAQCAIEARRRVITAMFVDSMELDGE